jgi:phage/plasmid primase-like uncharacterized protein/energy-coupling factor transporter ATP-binding protein EcfA2
MADLTSIFGGEFVPPELKNSGAIYLPKLSPEAQLINAISACGIEPPTAVFFDGKIHRFKSGTKGSGGSGDKTGWYIAFSDGIPAGKFGCWRAGIEQSFRAETHKKMDAADEMAYSRRMQEARQARDLELKKIQENSAETAKIIWQNAQAAHPDHPYLMRKKISPHGARVTGDGRLVVPLFDAAGELNSLQYIAHDGQKRYHESGRSGGMFWCVGSLNESSGRAYIAEGYATAATIYETTKTPCFIAYSASNLAPVCGTVREILGADAEIIIVADNDRSQTGQKYADQASAKYGAAVIMPPIQGMDANDYREAGFDLSELLNPTRENWLIQADEFSQQPAPVRWLIKKWVQEDALIMIHGPSGSGKTFLVLDLCLRIAADHKNWCGYTVKNGPIVYLAGEGHHGLRGRIAAWKHKNGAKKLNAWLSREGCDLNTAGGYTKTATAIRQLGARPKLIVVDTLHRFLNGDENSAQDAKTMLDACSNLMREFSCSVLLVHHTGVSDDAQHRARGSSAWRGALDIEINVTPAEKSNGLIQVAQKKSKDSELENPLFFRLEKVQIPNWVDEENEPVFSAVLTQSEAGEDEEITQRKWGETQKDVNKFKSAWVYSGREERNNSPYLSRSALINYLIINEGLTEATAKTYVKDGRKGRLIFNLIDQNLIRPHEHGWLIIDQVLASIFMISANS